MRSNGIMERRATCVGLAWLPMSLALAGVVVEERTHLGFSTWLSACRAAGTSLSSVLVFTLELLPLAVIGMLAGGALVLVAGILARRRGCAARTSLAAHAGCVIGMAAGLLLCTLALPVTLALACELLLAGLVAAWLFRPGHNPAARASVKPPTAELTSAQ